MNRTVILGATGFGLIAVCYGFARFAFGLFLPAIADDFELSSTLAGIISAGSFLGFCLAIVVAAWLTERVGPCSVAVAAGAAGAVGMIGIASSASPAWLAAYVILAGSSTGLASPALAAAVTSMVPADRQDATNTFINAGTSAGVALSGPVAALMGAEWRLAYAGFAGAAVLMAWATLKVLAGAAAQPAGRSPLMPPLTPDLKRLAAAAGLSGAASTVVWSFGADLLAANLDWSGGQVGMLWAVIGCAGVVGAMAGSLIARFGMRAVHLVFHIALGLAVAAVGLDGALPWLVLMGGGLFGAAYLMLTGVYLVWGISALPERPATGVTLAFLALAVGQTLGAMAFGFVMERVSANVAVSSFAALAVSAGFVRRRCNGKSE
ncbi:MFS transporter [Massilia sp. CFBP9026]|uniref:MFS transporter n=1 Tax=Massilia sp. CFBP9026 TaxID=3096536 RepID=UPI002A6B272C|nr:MFS transporter [Massilia sp. CFBP9026]MDY0961233.1 MFS transporter [Massilia sp. CFBP9026]